MKIFKKIYKIIASSLASILFLSIAFSIDASAGTVALPNARFTPVELKETLQKSVIRYASLDELGIEDIEEKMNASKIEDVDDVAGISDAEKALLLAVGVGKVKSYVRDGYTLWIGTMRGLIRINVNDEEPRNYVQYFRGPRYFGPIGNSNLTDYYDEITRLCSDQKNGIYVEAKLGNGKTTISHIKMESKSFKEKADKYEETANYVLDRRGMVSEGNFNFVFKDGKTNTNGIEEPEMKGLPSTSDNDGLWTAMYGIGEIYKYATLKREYGETHPETIAARESAVRAVEAVLLLCHISGRGNGFPARSYILDLPGDPRNEVPYQTLTRSGTSYTYVRQSINGLWFKKNGVREDGSRYAIVQNTEEAYPNPYRLRNATVANKVNYEGYPDEDYDGLVVANAIAELTQEQLVALTNLDPSGEDPTLDNVKWIRDETLDFDNNSNTFAYRIISDIKVDVPERLRYLYEDVKEYWRINNYADLPKVTDENIVYKADTSSDEMIGHMTLWYIANKYLVGTSPDADLKDLQDLIIKTTVKFMDHVLENKYRVMDATGKSTRWAKWWMEYFNGIVEPDLENDIEFPYGFEDVPINSMEVLSFLKTAIVLTEGKEGYEVKNFAYKKAYDKAYEPFDRANPLSGSGYGEGTLNYLNRRVAILAGLGFDRQKDDYTLSVNYSDEELYAMAILPLVDSEFDPEKRTVILQSFDQLWDNMKREDNPFYTFLYQLAYPEKTDIDLKNAVWFLERMPQYRIHYATKNLDRDDIIRIKDGDRNDVKEQINRLLAPDEKRIHKDNNNPFKVDETGNVLEIDSGAVYTIPYWMGVYYGMIIEDIAP